MTWNVKPFWSLLKSYKTIGKAIGLLLLMKPKGITLNCRWKLVNFIGVIFVSMWIPSKVTFISCSFIWSISNALILGNEEDYIIVSVVRNREIGFLRNLRRTNVMLSRCKKGMFIFSSKQFLTGPGAGTLVGTLLTKMGGSWLTESDIDEKDLF